MIDHVKDLRHVVEVPVHILRNYFAPILLQIIELRGPKTR